MALKALLGKEEFEKLPDAVKAEYKQDGDNYVLDVDDSDFKSKLGEFRSNNIALKQQQDDLKKELAKFKDIDPEKAREAAKRLQELEDQKLVDAGKLDELLEQRTERMRQDFENQTKSLQEALDSEKKRAETNHSMLEKTLIDSQVASAVSQVGSPVKGGMEDILGRARRIWQLQDGKPVPLDQNGGVKYGKDGKAPMTMEEWAQSLVTEAPFLFEGNRGGAGGGSGGGGNSKSINYGDFDALSSNLEAVAKGDMKVVSQAG